MPSFCAAAASGCTGNPTIPNMYSTPCFLRLRATSVAPSTSAMRSLLSECERRHHTPRRSRREDDRLAGALRVEDPVGFLRLLEAPPVREELLDVDLAIGDELGALGL